MTRVVSANSFAQLAFHGLAQLPLVGAHSLFDARYVDWCEAYARDADEPLRSDAGRIAMQLEALHAGLAVQWLPKLYDDVDAFVRDGALALHEVEAGTHVDAHALRALQSVDPRATEWLRADLLLVAPAFSAREGRGGDRARASPLSTAMCDEVAELLASVPMEETPAHVALVHALGAHGRAFDDVVFVGAPATWNAVTPALSAVIALHEHAVCAALGDYVRSEWAALQRVANILADGPGVLRDAHAAWLRDMDLAGLMHEVVARGLVSALDAQRLLDAEDRSQALARFSAP